jgi:hypothetical protein
MQKNKNSNSGMMQHAAQLTIAIFLDGHLSFR